ncbi:transferase family hexapeptide repeat protein [Pontibacter ummariensis]|uniref:Transferase hexapeptide (Six repeat-containing protein) n=1 Tax=Pontibacter ummariensis TaxID=1610492 RepID=A0A239ELN1_9BACT|nr:acyltransferase [Pontibacter ummariensis]PRY13327.1 transferase family hexapeptide repeat protein [Pontibacter ummariensis]SNS45546.1 transferase hexapeptide (six repeat-containing protein) [Pontibacter ummariensis]
MKQLLRQLRFFYLVHLKWRRYQIGKNLYAGVRVYLWAREKLVIGNNFYIGRDSQIETDCIIGDNVIFGNKVAVVGKYDHHFQKVGVPIRLAPRIRDTHYSWKGLNQITVIEDDVWVGYGAIIMSGVKLGKGSIVAAGSVVTKDTEPYTIYAGNPARRVRDRFDSYKDLEDHILLEKQFLEDHKQYRGIESVVA